MTYRLFTPAVLLMALLHSPLGLGQEGLPSDVPARTARDLLNPRQSERLQQLSGQMLQAFATRESALKHEAETVRAQLQPVKDALAALEDQLEQDIRQRNQAGAAPGAFVLGALPALDVSPRAVDQEFDPAHPGKPLHPRQARAATQAVQTTVMPAPGRAQGDAESPRAREKHAAALERLAALRDGQLTPTTVVDRAAVEVRLAEIHARLDGLGGDPGRMLAEVKRLRLALNPPAPRPYIKSGPTDTASPPVRLKTKRKPNAGRE